jgi:ABC-type multidrug transport system fused ATPase/permease subunit
MGQVRQGAAARHGVGVFFLLPEMLRHHRLFAEAYVASIFLHLIGLCIPLFVGAVLDKVIVHQAQASLIVLTVAVVLAIVFDAAFNLFHDYLLAHANPKLDMRTASHVFAHAMSLPLRFFGRNQAGALIRDMQQDQVVRGFLTNSLFFSFTELAALLILLPVLLSFSPVLTVVVLVFSAAIAAVSACLARPFRRRMDAAYAAQGERQAVLVETLQGIATVKALGLERNRQALWERSTAEALDAGAGAAMARPPGAHRDGAAGAADVGRDHLDRRADGVRGHADHRPARCLPDARRAGQRAADVFHQPHPQLPGGRGRRPPALPRDAGGAGASRARRPGARDPRRGPAGRRDLRL